MIPNDNVDVRQGSAAALKQLKELLKNNKIVLVLVYADWCGHCQTFKKGEWSSLQNEPGRKIPMAQIQAEALDQTPLADTPVDGYPYVGVVGQDRRMANIANPRDMRAMRAVVNADPEEVLNGAPAANGAANGAENVPMNADEEEEPADENENENEPGTVSEPMDSATAEAQADEFQRSLDTMIPGSASLAANEYGSTGTMNAVNTRGTMNSAVNTRGTMNSAVNTRGTMNSAVNTSGTMNRVVAGPSAAPATPPDLTGDIAASPAASFTGKRVNLNTASADPTAPRPLVGGSLFATLKGIAKNGVKIASAATTAVTKGGARKTRRGRGGKPRRLTARKLRR